MTRFCYCNRELHEKFSSNAPWAANPLASENPVHYAPILDPGTIVVGSKIVVGQPASREQRAGGEGVSCSGETMVLRELPVIIFSASAQGCGGCYHAIA